MFFSNKRPVGWVEERNPTIKRLVILHSNGIQEKGMLGTGARCSHCSRNKHCRTMQHQKVLLGLSVG
ncbi:MAG: hypothetical protein F6K48_00125 [Okeania sp. SIO3H1]|uniref:hypothetical protein n=1 Tax=Okeania sp. SIO1I7 TaxID=2607772 RepID=UPI0013CD2809|nr:hypothetical protein [Okeania sp. SIO1I7]NEN87421.1 hypothetical protein [Okeania sp. SIO3H1]NET26051.1 hypothetical protein [Okeania sp. SIO1I7]